MKNDKTQLGVRNRVACNEVNVRDEWRWVRGFGGGGGRGSESGSGKEDAATAGLVIAW